jgi:arabinofuranosyltransferase
VYLEAKPLKLKAGDYGCLAVTLALFWFAFYQLVSKSSFLTAGLRHFALADDPMISMRYAHNLVTGHGLVFNPGERVEGITNLGWTFIMAAVESFRLGPDWSCLIMAYIAGAAVAVTAVISYLDLRRAGSSLSSLLGATMIALNGPLLVAAAGGFESPLQAMLVSFAFFKLLPDSCSRDCAIALSPWALTLCALAFLVRPDGIVFCALAFVFAFFMMPLKKFIFAAIPAIVIITGVLAGQFIYYGDLLPNTFYLKSFPPFAGIRPGLIYFLDFLRGPNSVLLIAAGLYCLLGFLSRAGLRFLPLALTVSAWLCYVVWVGGDCFACGRFFVPLLPLLAVSTVRLMRELHAVWKENSTFRVPLPEFLGRKAAFALLAAAALGCLNCQITAFAQISPLLAHCKSENEAGREAAEKLSVLLGSRQVGVGLFAAGYIPYLLPGYRFDDMLGKCDRRIAHTPVQWGRVGHNKWDMDYSLNGRKSDLIVCVLSPQESDETMKACLEKRVDLGYMPTMWLHPTFRSFYRQNAVALNSPATSLKYWAYFRQAPPAVRGAAGKE